MSHDWPRCIPNYILASKSACMHVCLPPRILIISDIIWPLEEILNFLGQKISLNVQNSSHFLFMVWIFLYQQHFLIKYKAKFQAHFLYTENLACWTHFPYMEQTKYHMLREPMQVRNISCTFPNISCMSLHTSAVSYIQHEVHLNGTNIPSP